MVYIRGPSSTRSHNTHRNCVFIPPRISPTNFCFEVIPTFWPHDLQYFNSPAQEPQRNAAALIVAAQ